MAPTEVGPIEFYVTPFGYFLLFFAIAVFAFGWLKGGHLERRGVLVNVLTFSAAAAPGAGMTVDGVQIVHAFLDFGLLIVFGWMALTGNRRPGRAARRRPPPADDPEPRA